MWLKLPNGRDELVVNEDHINRLLAEGAVEIPDPRLQPESAAPLAEEQEAEEVTQQLPAQKKQQSKRATKPAKE
jgi:hypothetical protein